MNRELAAGHSGLLRRAGAADPPSEIYLGGLRPASYYQFCVRAYQEDNFGATEYQCVDGFTAPTTAKAPPPVNVLFLECFNDRVTASWHPPLILPGDPLLVRFDYTWTGTLAGSGLPTASQIGMVTALHPIQLIYSAQTDIFAAGDAVDFSVSAIYQVGTEPDGYSFYTSEVTRVSGAACTVPHLTEPTADLWLMLGGVRSDVGIVVPVGAEVDLMWRTTGANDGATLVQDGATQLSTDLINLLGLTQNSSVGVTRDYVLSARNTDGITAVDSISITWQTEDDPIWDRTVTVILIIKDIDPPVLTVVCANGALTASWTIDIAAGLTLTSFAYSVIVAEVDEIGEIEGVLGPDARSISIPGSAEVITFVIAAVYTGADGTAGLMGPSASATCGLPGSPSDLTLDCVPGVGAAAVATARWTPPPPVDGFTFVHYEYIWFFDDELMSRTGDPMTDVLVSMVSSQDGDYLQGDLARFSISAVFTNTLLDPDEPTRSRTLTANALCEVATPTHTFTATATHTATSTFTATPTATPVPEIIVALLDADDVLLPEMSPGTYMIVHGNPVTVRATFRFFRGDHRFNLEMAPTDGSALDGAACYGPGMLSVRTFSTAGEDIVETGNILASCPTGEYHVTVNQADGASVRGVNRPIFVPTKVVRQTPPTFTAMVAVGGTRAVNLSAVGAEYDAFVYRISGGGIVSEWLPLEDTVQIPPVFGSDITIEARGCIFDTDGDCPVDGPIASAQLTLPALSDPSDEPNLNPVFVCPTAHPRSSPTGMPRPPGTSSTVTTTSSGT